MGKKIKRPPVTTGSKIGKITESREIPAEQQFPVFSLKYLQGDYCVTLCEKEDQAAFALKMHRLSQLT